MARSVSRYYLLLVLLLAPSVEAAGVDLGLGLSFIDPARGAGLELGWDLQLGYEFWERDSWNLGAQLALTRGMTAKSDLDDETDLSFSSTALYLTARPKGWWLNFKGGVVQGDYHTLSADVNTIGYGLGVGAILDYDRVRLHLLDYQRLTFGADSFNLYTVSIAVLAH